MSTEGSRLPFSSLLASCCCARLQQPFQARQSSCVDCCTKTNSRAQWGKQKTMQTIEKQFSNMIWNCVVLSSGQSGQILVWRGQEGPDVSRPTRNAVDIRGRSDQLTQIRILRGVEWTQSAQQILTISYDLHQKQDETGQFTCHVP